jgi:hypothetical protein
MNGEVYEVRKKGSAEDSDTYAVKSVKKKQVKQELLDGLKAEIEILKQVFREREEEEEEEEVASLLTKHLRVYYYHSLIILV